MLLDSHNLNAVITVLDDSWKHLVLELCVCAYLLLILSHTNMALIDKQRVFLWLEGSLLPDIVLFWRPYLSRENLCILILNNSANICWNALTFSTFPFHLQLEEVAMLHG